MVPGLDLNTSCWNVELQVTVGPSATLRKSRELNNNLGLDPFHKNKMKETRSKFLNQ